MTLANAMVLVDQTAVPLTLAEIMRTYDVGSQKAQWVLNASLPGLLLYGGGPAIVLTVNDPVSLNDVPEAAQGQAAGVSATAEQFGGALGIAVLYLIFHTTYVAQLHAIINNPPLADLTQDEYVRLKADIIAAESTGLKPKLFDPSSARISVPRLSPSSWGYAAAFLAVSLLGIVGCVLAWRAGRSRKDAPPREAESSVDSEGVADSPD